MSHYKYEVWDDLDDLAYSPSVLYSLEPIGIGTPQIESLTSYIKRLACTHHVTVQALTDYCRDYKSIPNNRNTAQKLSGIDGITSSSNQWSKILFELTQNTQVNLLTMGYWSFMLNSHRLLRFYQAWCPLCYASWAIQNSTIYNPLLWRLQAVDYCSVHKIKLIDTCSKCFTKFRALTYNSVPGFCAHCNAWLGRTISNEYLEEASMEHQISELAGKLLALAPVNITNTTSIISKSIKILSQEKNLSYTQISAALGVRDSTTSELSREQKKLSLYVFLRICILSDKLPLCLLEGENNYRNFDYPIGVKKSVENIVEDKESFLKTLLNSSARLPRVAEVAKCCGYSCSEDLQKEFPTLYAALNERSRQEMKQALLDAMDSDEIIGVTEVARRNGYKQGILSTYFPEVCQQLTELVKQRKRARCLKYLQIIISSSPDIYPSNSAICKDLGVGIYYLQQNCSTEITKLEELRKAKSASEENLIRFYMQTIWTSEPEPRLKIEEIAKKFNKSIRSLKSNFPEESNMVLAYHRDIKEQTKQQKCDFIQQLVFKLHQDNIYPSIDRIHSAIDCWLIRGTPYRKAYIGAMRICGYSLPD